jgi:hypothetical protein
MTTFSAKMSEYIKLAHSAVVYSKKNLLQSQLESLHILQKIDAYKKFRSEELNLKIALKKKLDEARTEIAAFVKLMPKSSMPKEEIELNPEQQAKRQSLETEVEVIKQKLMILNG